MGPAKARALAVKPCFTGCALAVEQHCNSDVDHKRISWLRASDYSEVANYGHSDKSHIAKFFASKYSDLYSTVVCVIIRGICSA